MLANHHLKPLIAWQCMSLVTSYSCSLYQISCLKFHPNLWSHCGSLFVWCIWSVQTPGSTCTIKDRSLKTFLIIWTAVIKPLTYTGIEAEWRPCLYRVGLFDKAWDLPPSRFPWETADDLADDRESFRSNFSPQIRVVSHFHNMAKGSWNCGKPWIW